jgi:predicted MFS family arabinose efflux permease
VTPAFKNPLLQDRDGRRLAIAQFADHFGIGIANVALPWLVLSGGGGVTLTGLVFTMGTLPYLFFGLVAGVTGDRRSRKRIMLVAFPLQALVAGLVPLWDSLTGQPPVALVLCSAFAVGVGRVYVDAASFGAVADIIGRESFVQGQAVFSVAWAAGQIAGPALAGVLIAAIGPAETIVVQSGCFVLGALAVLGIRRPLAAPYGAAAGSRWEALRAGFGVIRDVPLLRLLTTVQVVWYFAVVATLALQVPFLREALELDARRAGWILGVSAAMGVLGSAAVGPLERRFGGIRLIAASAVGTGVGILALSAAPGFVTGLLCYCLVSLSGWISMTSLIGERQRHAPGHLQARVGITGRSIAFTSLMLGSLAASGLAGVVSLRALYAGVGVTALLIAAWSVPALLRAASGSRPPAGAGVAP